MTAGTSVASHDRYDTKEAALRAVTAYATALAGGDDSDLEDATAGANALRETVGRATLNLRGAFTVSGATAVVVVALYLVDESGADVFMGHKELTLTGLAARLNTAGDRFFSVISPNDLAAAHKYQLRVIAAPSAGTVDLFAWEA